MNTYQDLTEREQKEFTAKLMTSINKFPHAYMMALSIIELAEKYGVFKQVKFDKK
jgi:hypothetical protein